MGRKRYTKTLDGRDAKARMCGSKKTYNKKLAQTVANRRRREGGPRLRPYHCRYCNAWHLTKGEE